MEHDQEFEVFVGSVTRRLLHAADLLTGSRSRAEDLVQHGLANAYARWPSIRLGHPEAYVRRAMLNRYLDWWRRVRWRESQLPDAPDDADWLAQHGPARYSGLDLAEDVARRDVVQRALAGLTSRERAVVVLRFWLDLSEAQIAQELHIRPGTVKSTSARALSRLRTDPGLMPSTSKGATP